MLNLFHIQFAFLKKSALTLLTVILFISVSSAKDIRVNDLFIIQKNPELQARLKNFGDGILTVSLNEQRCSEIVAEKPDRIFVTLPVTENSNLEIELTVNNIFSGELDAGVFTSTGSEKSAYVPGAFYKGKIAGVLKSVVSFSFFKNSLMGFISGQGDGNLIISKCSDLLSASDETYLIYNDHKLSIQNNFVCGTEPKAVLKKNIQRNIYDQYIAAGSSNCVHIYFECDYQMYLDWGTITDVYNFVTAIFNQVATLYSNENVSVTISSIYVWTTVDPYRTYNTSGDCLTAFRSTRTTFNGDIAHLLSTRSINVGGVAWVNVLCNSSYAYAYSNIYNSYATFPTYSWTVMVITHEVGHNLGSNHTQWCGWPGGAIDNCYTTEGGCAPGPAPVTGGTIMSYCHLTGYGINFVNGFGPLPGNAIRSGVSNAACLSSCLCTPDVTISVSPSPVICTGTNVTFTATPVNGGTNPTYQWQRNGANVGTNNSAYSTTTVSNGDIITCKMTTSDGCAGAGTLVSSNAIIMAVNFTVTPTISISARSTTICQGVPVTFISTYTNGGPVPAFQWRINGINVGGANASTFMTSALNNGNAVTCQMTSNLTCASPSTAVSNGITVTTSPNVTPTISISTPATTICQGTGVTFNAAWVSGGTTPSFQWKINGLNAGPDSSHFTTTTLNNGDIVTCQLTSSNPCANPTIVSSNPISMVVNGTGVIPTNGLLAWYPFNGNTLDNSGNNFNGTSSGATLTNNRYSQNNNAFEFNGARDQVQVGNPSGLNSITTGLTVSAWVYLGANNSSQAAIVSKWKFNQTDDQYLLWLYNDRPNFAIGNPATAASGVQSNVTLNDSIWYLLVGTWDNSGTHKLYINGVLNSSTVFPAFTYINNSSPTDLRIGTEDSTWRAFRGKIDDVRIYSRALTPQEVQILWNEGTSASVSINTNSSTTCQGQNLTFNASANGAGNNPSYQWKLNGFNTGTNSATYNSTNLSNGDIVSCLVTSSDPCAQPHTAISNTIQVTIIPPVNQSLSINVSANPACTGSPVTFNASPNNGSLVSTYAWKVNGNVIAGNDSDVMITSSLITSDIIICEMTSLAPCVSPAVAISNSITMSVNAPNTPAITISTNSANICPGDSVDFSAITFFGGVSPVYSWYINSVLSGNGASYHLANASNQDSVSCILQSSESCVVSPIANSNVVVINVNTPVIPFIIESSEILYASPSASYQWYMNGFPISNDTVQTLAPLITGYYQVETTDSNGCSAISSNYGYILGIENLNTANGVSIFPNPAGYDAILELSGHSYIKADILAADGKLVFNLFDGDLNQDNIQLTIPAGKMADGIYYVRIIRDRTVGSYPFVVTR